MDYRTHKENDQFDDLPHQHEFANTASAAGFWFAAAALFAVLAAGIIVYRSANSDGVRTQTAAIDMPATAHVNPMWPATILPPR